MTAYLFSGGRLLDPRAPELREGMPLTLLTTKAVAAARRMLMRGFTTVRDAGGSDWGLKTATDDGIVEGPSVFIAGMPISQTGGHGDFRRRTQTGFECACSSGLAYMSRIADGVPDMLKAVRNELRKGADQIKLMVSGGVASQTRSARKLAVPGRRDRGGGRAGGELGHVRNGARVLGASDRTRGRLRRAHDRERQPDRRTGRAAHGIARRVHRADARDVRQPATSRSRLRAHGVQLQKNRIVLEAGLRSLELCRAAGVQIGFGTDLLGALQDDQCKEFQIRAQAMKPHEVIRSATLVNAEIVQRAGELGELVPGALADLLVVDGDPYRDLGVLQDQGARIAGIMKGGRWFKNAL
ncbi:MAG TPA: amidohydrolase family protein [Casimicrobiaceae bacterium]|nr:amidohydrolase family protein [Casimicrobiaceae bacterium]